MSVFFVKFCSRLGTKMAEVYDLAFHQIPDFPKQYFYILIHKMSCHAKKKWSVAGSCYSDFLIFMTTVSFFQLFLF